MSAGPASSDVARHHLARRLNAAVAGLEDPSTPMDTNAMMSQTTQLAMMEQVTAQTTTANENFSLQMRIAASNLVGREVSYTGPDGVEVKGTATSVSFAEAVPKVSVGGKEVALDLISGIATTKA